MSRAKYTATDAFYRNGWQKRPFDAPSVLCVECSADIRGSHDTIQSVKGEQMRQKPAPVCVVCMARLQDEAGTQFELPPPSKPAASTVSDLGPECVACKRLIRDTPYPLFDSGTAEPWGVCCWTDRCRLRAKQERRHHLELLAEQHAQDARYGS